MVEGVGGALLALAGRQPPLQQQRGVAQVLLPPSFSSPFTYRASLSVYLRTRQALTQREQCYYNCYRPCPGTESGHKLHPSLSINTSQTRAVAGRAGRVNPLVWVEYSSWIGAGTG